MFSLYWMVEWWWMTTYLPFAHEHGVKVSRLGGENDLGDVELGVADDDSEVGELARFVDAVWVSLTLVG